MRRTRIKICGVRDAGAALAAAEAGADAVGLMFVQRSPRAIDAAMGREIMGALPEADFVAQVVQAGT